MMQFGFVFSSLVSCVPHRSLFTTITRDIYPIKIMATQCATAIHIIPAHCALCYCYYNIIICVRYFYYFTTFFLLDKNAETKIK